MESRWGRRSVFQIDSVSTCITQRPAVRQAECEGRGQVGADTILVGEVPCCEVPGKPQIGDCRFGRPGSKAS